MDFGSELAASTKLDRAAVLTLALADLAVRGGERVGLLGLSRPIAARGVIDRFAEILARRNSRSPAPSAIAAGAPIAARSKVVLIGDFLSAGRRSCAKLRRDRRDGAEGQVLMIADPIEETFPFQGHTDFLAPAEVARLRAPRAQNLRDRLSGAAGRPTRGGSCGFRARGWDFALHRTDDSAASGAAEPARAALRARTGQPRLGGLSVRLAARLRRARRARRSGRPRRALLFLRVTPPRPRQVVFPPLRLLLGLDARKPRRPDALAAAAAAARHRRGGHPGDGGADLERG